MNNIFRIKNGVIWSGIEKIAYSGGQLGINLIIARLILPEEYALIAMIAIFIAIGYTFIDSGFNQALIHKQDRSEVDLSTVFYFNIGVAIILYLIIYISSPLIAEFYNNKIFIPLTRAVSLNLIISSFANVQRAILVIRVDFKTQAIISVISVIISGFISIWMAFHGFGVWAMVAQTLIVHGVASVLLWIMVKWRPKLIFSIKSFKHFFSYGSRLLLSKIINSICQNIYTVAIGKIYSANQVAYFNNANQLSLYSACYINDIISRALFPILCEKQSEPQKLLSFYYRVLSISAYVIFPIMFGLIVLAKPFTLVVLGEKWLGMVPYMRIIAFAYMWYPVMSSNQLFTVIGRTDIYLKCEIIKKIIFVALLLSTIFINVTVVCWGIVVYNLSETIVTLLMLKPYVKITYKGVLFNVIPSLLLAIGMSLTIILITSIFSSEKIQLIFGVVIGVISYFLYSKITKSKNLSDIIKIIKTRNL